MKKILLILLCLPLFVFSQEKKKYENTMSFSQFAEELKEAADKGIGYTIEDYYITYDTIGDKEYVYKPESWWRDKNDDKFYGDMQIKGLSFNKFTKVKIANCRFGERGKNWNTTITFKECYFDTLEFQFNDIGGISIDNSNISDLSIQSISISDRKKKQEIINERHNQSKGEWFHAYVQNSKIKKIYCAGTYFNEIFGKEYPTIFSLDSSEVLSLDCDGFKQIHIEDNIIGNCDIGAMILDDFYTNNCYNGDIYIRDNVFKESEIFKNELVQINIFLSNKNLEVKAERNSSPAGLFLRHGFKSISIQNNTFSPKNEIHQDSILQLLLNYQQKGGKQNTYIQWNWDTNTRFDLNDYINISNHNDTIEIEDGVFYHDSISFNHKFKLLKKFAEQNKIQLDVRNRGINIFSSDVNRLKIRNNKTPTLSIGRVNINDQFEAINNIVDSLTWLKSNTLPEFNKVITDFSFTNKLGFYHSEKVSYGLAMPKDLDSTNTELYNKNIKALITTYRQIISILSLKGDDLKTNLIVRLKDIETNKKGLIYHQNPNIENWFNWQGSKFIKWYSDYGMNPFKALAYCFWAMLYFAMFYFIFYNEWDKIDRGFLIKRFNSVMDYFTTEKRIEDFYATTHNKEMTTFTEFKDTLDKNKVYMPTILASLAKPIYHISLLRYKLLNFSYKKAEFMAGRKWVDLEQKEKYWIGALTFLLTLTYIIYLIFIRALNSIVLSINAFSTLGFGQIPVRGFTKYVAIIEGFIGWFMLSIFLVSVLSQMMSV